MSTFTVSTSTALIQALHKANAGDTIALTEGMYDPILIRGIDAKGVTITSADPKKAAVLTGLTIRDSTGITVSNVELFANKAGGNAQFVAHSSSDIHFDKLKVYGKPELADTSEINGLQIRNSVGVTVTNSEFYDLRHALGIADTTNAVLSGNSFHDIRTDGIRGGGNSNLTISKNMFTNFTPAQGDHADAIQLWTTNKTESARNIVISDNLVVRGDGAPIQGIFIRDQGDNLPYYNVVVTGNMVLGGNANGIALNGVIGGTISGNTVIGSEDHRSWIRVDESHRVTVNGNVSTFYMVDGATRDGILENNTIALGYHDNGAGQIYSWLQQNAAFAAAWGTTSVVMSLLSMTAAEAQAALDNAPDYVTVQGTNGADRLKVRAGFDSHLYGGNGNDSLTGGETNNNKLFGGAGNDTYSVLGVGDTVIEEARGGVDTVSASIDYTLPAHVEDLRLAEAGLTGTGNELDNRIIGSDGADRVFGLTGDDILQGLGGNDYLVGGFGDDSLKGGDGHDTVYGGMGTDALYGGDGNDMLFGDSGNDFIEGGAGTDRMTGGGGIDLFRFRSGDIAGDVITDFMRRQDRIDLKSIDARAHTARDDAFTFIGTAGFHKVAGELRYEVSGGNAFVSGDINGDGKADFTLNLLNVTLLHGSDFVL